MSNTVNVFETGIIGPCMSSMNYKKKNLKIENMDKNENYLKDLDIITELMKSNHCNSLDELMKKEMNFNDKELLNKLNSPEFRNKFNLDNIKLGGE